MVAIGKINSISLGTTVSLNKDFDILNIFGIWSGVRALITDKHYSREESSDGMYIYRKASAQSWGIGIWLDKVDKFAAGY